MPRFTPKAVVGFFSLKWPSWEVLGDTEGSVCEAMQAVLKRATAPAKLHPASVRLEQCRSSIERVKKPFSELEAEKARQTAGLREAEVRFVRLEAEMAAPPPVPAATAFDLEAAVVTCIRKSSGRRKNEMQRCWGASEARPRT